jgi:hypothetical protein
MSLTKPEMWLGIIAIVLVFTFSIVNLGGDLLNSNVQLDNKSVQYIQDFSQNVEKNNLQSYQTNETLELKKGNPIVEFATNLPIIQDVVGGINFFIDKTKNVMGALSIVYNLPTFFLQGFGLPVGNFAHVINIIGFILLISFTIILVRLVK